MSSGSYLRFMTMSVQFKMGTLFKVIYLLCEYHAFPPVAQIASLHQVLRQPQQQPHELGWAESEWLAHSHPVNFHGRGWS